VILHDSHFYSHFQENDLVIPLTVIEELDNFKKGNEQLNYNSRVFMRKLDELSKQHELFAAGVLLGKNRGKIWIETSEGFDDVMKKTFWEDIPDHRILAAAMNLKKRFPQRIVSVVSKDINIRIKAKSLGLFADDYLSDKVPDEHLDFGKRVNVFLKNNILIDELYQKKETSTNALNFKPIDNQYLLLKSDTSSAMCRYYAEKDTLKLVQKRRAYGIEARNVEQSFAFDALLDPALKLVSMSGIAGTGKTLLALAAALFQKENYEQIILARPVIPLQYQQIGFLPGDETEKIMPYMLPLFDNLNFIKNRFGKLSKEATQIDDWLRKEELVISPLAYIRGRSLSNVLFIIDEAQNLTPHEVKTIITRAGENTKIILTGDIYQIDSPYLDMYSNGLSYLSEKMSGQKLYAHINLIKGERSELSEIAGKLL
jgi:PhoH-like ATPase